VRINVIPLLESLVSNSKRYSSELHRLYRLLFIAISFRYSLSAQLHLGFNTFAYFFTADKTLLLLLVVAVTLSLEHSVPVHGFLAASSDCQRSCGNISIPYPFGIGAACSWEPSFNVSCVVDGQGQEAAYLRVGDSSFKLFEIDVSQGEVRVGSPISSSCRHGPKLEPLFVPVPPFTVSNSNKLTAIGCATVAGIGSQSQDGYTSACGSFCNQDSMGNITECAGIGCCQTSIPSPGNLRSLNASFIVTADNLHISTPHKFSSPCSYAFVADANWFKFHPLYVTSTKFGEMYGSGSDRGVPLVLDWVVGNGTCEEAVKNASSYACLSDNSFCLNASIGLGYRCEFLAGFEGNPYLDRGCQGQHASISIITTFILNCNDSLCQLYFAVDYCSPKYLLLYSSHRYR